MSIEKILKMMFEYFRAIPEHVIRLETCNVSESCAYRLGYVRISINE
ncbi:hypothetical protein AGMMS50233_04230 [Endomicrobiia bacterium]|nr:hypothetical protein AGMMS50233_04230 [Endomicrobiia bacterium]